MVNVVIELEGAAGKVIIATPKKTITGQIVWDESSGLYASYDNISDVFYVSIGDAREAYADDSEWDERVWLRYFSDNDAPAGATVFDLKKMHEDERILTINNIAKFLSIQSTTLLSRFSALQ